MFVKRIRGGLVQASTRYGKANIFTVDDYNTTKDDSSIIYQDCNEQFVRVSDVAVHASRLLPVGRAYTSQTRRLHRGDDTSPIGRVYEVEIEYPEYLHVEHNDLPFLPNNGVPPGSKVKKLMATLDEKTNYIIHYRNSKQAMANGLIVKKVHTVLEFRQSPWLVKYIDLNTKMREKATNKFEKDFYKLMNNATIESMRRRIDVQLVSSEKRVLKLINKTTFKHCTTYNKNVCAVTLENKIIHFCKPIYIGFAVLNISKTKMDDYHYNVMWKHFKDTINLMYTDTDSLVYHIVTMDFYADLLTRPVLLECMDTANLPRGHPCYVAAREKLPGLLSDESDGRTITVLCVASKSVCA
ncbi:Hypothetical protein CINCED_3A024149 [Cinara cedri]|uniref:DNA-directed DNA polymerase n=1 Tax=Cinara cedri TaxID=506608 RepID=A0A5E4MPW8_9HEMI|nr:Hypothetical protein CINCED_3A024149 [Cinara cedri]